MRKRILVFTVLTILISIAAFAYAFADETPENSEKSRTTGIGPETAAQSGWVSKDESWYYILEDGVNATGWLNDEGTWYYFYEDGRMATGWVSDGNAWYYMEPSGAMRCTPASPPSAP